MESRPAVKQTRVVLVRFAPREHQRILAAAAARSMRVTDFCRSAIRVAAGCLPVERRREPSP
jgi:hypothetical protein